MRRAIFVSNPSEPTGTALAVTTPKSTTLALVTDDGALDQHPAAVYLASLSPGSRRTMRGALRTIALILSGVADELLLPWHLLDYAHAVVVRTKLAEKLAPATANRMLAALKGTLKNAFKLGLISADHYTRAAMIEPVRRTTIPKGRALSHGELRALFGACDASTPGGARNAALLGLLYGAGLRRAEVVGLNLSDFDGDGGSLTIRGKGRKTRRGFVTNGSLDALLAWLTFRGDEAGPLFYPVKKGGLIERRRMTDGAVAELVRRLAAKAQVAAFSPHDMRRTFIGDLLEGGADLATVQGLAGHSNPSTTSRYDRRPDRTRRKAVELLHVPFVAKQ